MSVSVAVVTATFNVVYAALYRPPPFADPSRVAMIYSTHRAATGRERAYEARWSYPRLRVLQDSARSLTSIAAYSGTELNLSGGDEVELVRGEFVSPEYFRVLGVTPTLGRTFLSSENDPRDRAPVVVISHNAWNRLFGARRDVIGGTLRLNGTTVSVIGVMPRGFRGLTDRAQLWLPSAMATALTYAEYFTTNQDFISVIGRLAPNETVGGATVELARLAQRAYAEFPSADADSAERPAAKVRTINDARVLPQVRAGMLLLLGAVTLLHLLSLANASSLLLGRAFERAREYAVRTALGATSGALRMSAFRDAATHGLVGGVVGTMVGVVLGALLPAPLDIWGAQNFYGSLASFAEPGVNLATVAFGACLTIVSALILGVAPAMVAARRTWVAALRDASRGSSGSGLSLRRPSPRAILVAAEVALAMALCTAGGLIFDSFLRMKGTPIGVEADGVLTFSVRPSETRVPVATAPAYISRMLAAIEAVPGVKSVTVDGGAPVSGTARSTLHIVGRAPAPNGAAPPILRHYVAPGHFATLGIPLLEGRSFTARDNAESPGVTIISASAARTFWPNESAIGRRVWFGGGSTFNSPDSSAEVIGVVGDVMYEPLDATPNRASFYTTFAQFSYAWRVYFVRASAGVSPLSLVAPIRRAVRGVDADVPVAEVRDLKSLIGASWTRQRADAILYGSFAALALGIAVAGIYAVIAHNVSQRTREMGIRMALGAAPGGIVRLVLREGVVFPLAGTALGVLLSIAAGGVIRASLRGVSTTAPGVYVVCVVLMFAAAAAASLVPAIRATRVDPMTSLRAE